MSPTARLRSGSAWKPFGLTSGKFAGKMTRIEVAGLFHPDGSWTPRTSTCTLPSGLFGQRRGREILKDTCELSLDNGAYHRFAPFVTGGRS